MYPCSEHDFDRFERRLWHSLLLHCSQGSLTDASFWSFSLFFFFFLFLSTSIWSWWTSCVCLPFKESFCISVQTFLLKTISYIIWVFRLVAYSVMIFTWLMFSLICMLATKHEKKEKKWTMEWVAWELSVLDTFSSAIWSLF